MNEDHHRRDHQRATCFSSCSLVSKRCPHGHSLTLGPSFALFCRLVLHHGMITGDIVFCSVVFLRMNKKTAEPKTQRAVEWRCYYCENIYRYHEAVRCTGDCGEGAPAAGAGAGAGAGAAAAAATAAAAAAAAPAAPLPLLTAAGRAPNSAYPDCGWFFSFVLIAADT